MRFPERGIQWAIPAIMSDSLKSKAKNKNLSSIQSLPAMKKVYVVNQVNRFAVKR